MSQQLHVGGYLRIRSCTETSKRITERTPDISIGILFSELVAKRKRRN